MGSLDKGVSLTGVAVLFTLVLLLCPNTLSTSSHPSGAPRIFGHGLGPIVTTHASPSTAKTWKNVTSTTHPIARYGASMAFDAADHYVVLFGGDNASFDDNPFNDTWSFAGGVWTHLAPPSSPSPREFAPMAYDAADGYVVLFGGYFSTQVSPGSFRLTVLNDTWIFSHGSWSQLVTLHSPPACASGFVTYDIGVATFDSTIHAVLLEQIGCGYTWTFSNGTWSNVTTSSSPSGTGSGIANDPNDGGVLFFKGGFVRSGGTAYKYANSSWTQLPYLPTKFGSKAYPAMTYDKTLANALVFGGISGTYIKNGAPATVFNDTWRYAAGKWTQGTPLVSPPGRYYASLVFDAKDGVDVLFGGIGSGTGLFFSSPPDLLADTWTIA